MSDLILNEQSSDGSGVVTDASGAVWARAVGGNPLDENWPHREAFEGIIDGAGDAPRAIVWSGTTGEGLFEPHPSVWQQGAWDRFTKMIEDASSRSEASGVRLLVRTHAHHVLSDAPRCRTLGQAWEGSRVGILLDPRAMIDGSMSPDASDHLTRIAEDALAFSSAVLATEGTGARFSGWTGGDVIRLSPGR